MPLPFTRHRGLAAPLLRDNVDTDQIIPSREMKQVAREGLGQGLFAGWRYLEGIERSPDPGFVLNRPAFAGASVLIAGRNFGCGSSREHAVWALAEFGIRVVLAKGFGDIFYNNCLRNWVLALSQPEAVIEVLGRRAEAGALWLEVDLPAQTFMADGETYSFEIDPFQKRLLVEGLDPIGLTLLRAPEIAAFHAADRDERPWLYAGHRPAL